MKIATRKNVTAASAAVLEKNDFHDRLGRRIRNPDGTPLMAEGSHKEDPGPGVQKAQNLRELPVPHTILRELPEARWWFEAYFAMLESQLPVLRVALTNASRRDHVQFARAFVNLYKIREVIKEFEKQFEALWAEYNGKLMPDAIEGAGVTNVPLAEGLRVQRSQVTRASIREGMREAAHAWLKVNYPMVVTETVNASTLSSLAIELIEEQNIDLPDEMFNVALMPVMSITKIASKAVKPGKKRDDE